VGATAAPALPGVVILFCGAECVALICGQLQCNCLDITQAVRYYCIVKRSQIAKIAAALGKLGGSVKSKAKAKAARANGKKGGRPRKAKP
jgi:hypothetical protein